MSEKLSIAEDVLGIAELGHDGARFLRQTWHYLMGEAYRPKAMRQLHKKISEEGFASLSREEQEKYALEFELSALSEGRMWTANVLTDWPIYQSIMARYGERAPGKGRALLIGSYTPLSSRSFVCMAGDLLGCDQHIIVDPKTGLQKARHGEFLKASGTELPIRDGAIDFVVTNRLLHMLRDPSAPEATFEESTTKLIGEISRVLASSGQILMIETAPSEADGILSEKDADALEQRTIALSERIVHQFWDYDMEATRIAPIQHPFWPGYMFDPERRPDYRNLSDEPGGFAVFARKPAFGG